MKLRSIILILAILGIASIAFGGYIYYASLRQAAIYKADREAILRATTLSQRLSSHMAMSLRAVRVLAGQEELRDLLAGGDAASLRKADLILDRFCAAMETEVCYLMDDQGITRAATNRHTPESFVGKNYSFRPYFLGGIEGTPTVYMALGVTSARRGIYFSQPVLASPAAPPLGVAVVKSSLGFLDEIIEEEDEGIWTVTSPEGVIFASNRQEWLLRSMRPLRSEDRENLARSKQFGTGDWEWTGITVTGPARAQDVRGNEFIFQEKPVEHAPGWKVHYLVDLGQVVQVFSSPLIGTTGLVVASGGLLALTVLFFYLRGNLEITQQIREEKALLASYAEELKRKVSELDGEIVERKKAEQEVQELNLTLESQVAERTSRLERTNKELEAFAYTISHDLRAPLRGISGLLSIIQSDYSGQFSIEARKLLDLVLENAKRMSLLIDGLLAFSRLGRQQLALQKVDPAELVKEVLDELEAQRGERRVDIVVRALPPCQADPLLLKVVFANLIGNALKFTGHRESARIEIGSIEEDNRHIFYVRDNGIGFDMRYADRLFGVFQRLHGEEFEGSGVGLATVQRIIERHGGTIWAEGEVDRGATFYFTLEKG